MASRTRSLRAAVAVFLVAFLVGHVHATHDSEFSLTKGGFLTYDDVKGAPFKVEYDGRSFAVAGERTLWLSGSVHPARVPPGEWNSTLRQMRDNGLNMVQIYVFWNAHEPFASGLDDESITDWGAVDLKKFVSLAAENGLFVNLRIGPYVCAEWKFGGLPLWLMNTTAFPDLALRTNEPTWQTLMGDWFQRVMFEMAEFLAPLGGPIVLTQVENELAYDAPVEYVQWAGLMARDAVAKAVITAQGFSVDKIKGNKIVLSNDGSNSESFLSIADVETIPVLMCEGSVAPNAVPACNGPTCAEYLTDPNSRSDMSVETDENAGYEKKVLVDYPGVWTENEGGYQTWGGSAYKPSAYFWGRGADDLAWASMRWFARGGSHMNYYMFVGGNNFGKTEGDAMTTAYATDVNVCPDGLPNEPKFSHMGNLHVALRQVAPLLLGTNPQVGRAVFLPHRRLLVADADGDGVWDGAAHEPLTFDKLNGGDGAAAMGHASGRAEEHSDHDTMSHRHRASHATTAKKSLRLSKTDAVLGDDELEDISRRVTDTLGDDFADKSSDIFTEVSSRKESRIQATTLEGFSEVNGNVVAFEYEGDENHTDSFIAFLENNSPRTVVADFKGGAFTLLGWSSVLLTGDLSDLESGDGGMQVVYNTSAVPLVGTLRKVERDATPMFEWRQWKEPTQLDPGMLSSSVSVTAGSPLPQIQLTGDQTEYVWYHASFQAPGVDQGTDVLPPVLWLKIVGRIANMYSVYVDGTPIAAVSDETHSPATKNSETELWVELGRFMETEAVRTLSILSESLGVSNYPIYPGDRPSDFEKGVVFASIKREDQDGELPFLTQHAADHEGDMWRMRVGLYGEQLNLYGSEEEAQNVKWGSIAKGAKVDGVTWLKAKFNAPDGFDISTETLLLDAGNMGRGHVYVNGHDIGRYWNMIRNDGDEPTQRFYVIPSEWLVDESGFDEGEIKDANTIVFAEVGGVAEFGASIAVARMEKVSRTEAGEAVVQVTGGRQKACEL